MFQQLVVIALAVAHAGGVPGEGDAGDHDDVQVGDRHLALGQVPDAGAPDPTTQLAPERHLKAAVSRGTVHIDGVLDEPFWDDVPWADDFTQQQPDPGKPPTQKTRVKFAYDGERLLVEPLQG